MSKRQKKGPVSMRCKNCGAALYPGVAHVCSVQSGNANGNELRGFLLKLLIPLIMLTVTELIGGVWWAATIQSGQQAQQEQLRQLKDDVSRIDGYFRRPLPQRYELPQATQPQMIETVYELLSAATDPQAQQQGAGVQRRRVVPLDVIKRFELKPSAARFGPFLLGEDGQAYDFDDVIGVIFELTAEHWRIKK